MDPLMLILVLGGGLALTLLVIGIVVTATSEKSLVDQRLGPYFNDEYANAAKKAEKDSPIGDWLNDQLEGSSYGDNIARELARADLKLKPAEYFAAMIISAFGFGVVLWFLGGRSNITGVMGALLGLFIPRLYVKQQQRKRLLHFGDQLSDMLNLMVNGLRAGYSALQAMEAVSREMPSPISDEFRRVVQEVQLGISLENALQSLLRRIPSDDLDLIITAMNVQRDVGGNLAEVLDTISFTIRERVRIKGEVRVLTSQVVYSGRFLSMMPLIISTLLWFLNRKYMMMFFNPDTRVPGIIALSIGSFMVMIGYFVMMRIAKIDV